MLNSIFDQMDFGPLQEFLDDDDITDVSYSNGGQVWLKTLSKGIYQVDRPNINNAFMEKLAFQCSNVMGKTFNMAHPFLDAESAELRMNFVHDSIATNGIAVLMRKTPAKIRLNKEKLINEDYVTEQIHDFLIDCVHARCNIIVAGETGSGKTELVKYLASKTKEDEKIISIEDTLELHLDRIYPNRDIVAMKTNNIASYTEALVACMRQNPIWILLAEVRSAEAVMAVRNSISSGHHILSTIHADKASSIPMRMYSLLESSQDTEQFLASIHRYVQIGIYVKGYFSKRLNRFQREILEVCEFYVDDDTQEPKSNILYKKTMDGKVTLHNPTQHLKDYMSIGNVEVPDDTFGLGDDDEKVDDTRVVPENTQAQAQVEEKHEVNKEDPFNMNATPVETSQNVENNENNVENSNDVNKAIETLDELSTPAPQVDTSILDNKTLEAPAAPVVQAEPVATTEQVTQQPQVAPQNVVTDLQNNIIQTIASMPVKPDVSHEVVEPPQQVQPQVQEPVLENLPKPVVNGFMQSPPSDAVV